MKTSSIYRLYQIHSQTGHKILFGTCAKRKMAENIAQKERLTIVEVPALRVSGTLIATDNLQLVQA